jgi:hypothetical protein
MRVRLRAAEGRVVDGLLQFITETWGEPLIVHAWEDFWNYEDVPEDLVTTPEFDPMFVPWLVLEFVPDAESDDADDDWPTQPIGLEWLATTESNVSDLDRAYIETACRSPMSVFAVEDVTAGRSLDLKDVLTGSRFHVLEQGASQNLRPADLIFTRIVTLEGVSLMFGAAPFVVPPRWHTHVIDWREQLMRKRLMTRQHLADFDLEIRDLYFEIAAELLNPTPPQLCNTDGEQIALTTLTFELKTTADEAFGKLAPLAMVHGEDHSDEVVRDASGAVTSAILSWVKSGNRKHKQWDNTVLGTIRIEAGRVVADVNSARRAERLKREIRKRLSGMAVLVNTSVVDPLDEIEERARKRATGDPSDDPRLEPSAELQEIQEEMIRQHWEAWLDTRVPALGNRTPRQAARTPSGRERLEALLAGFERDAANEPSNVAARLTTIRTTLGLTSR